MDFSTTTDNELTLMLQVASTQRDLLNEATARRQAEVTVFGHELKALQERARLIMVEQEKRAEKAEQAKAEAAAKAAAPTPGLVDTAPSA